MTIHLRQPTPEEIVKLDHATLAITKARRKIRSALPNGQSGRCTLWCPICIRGTISVLVEGGKMSGECSTKNCVAWTNK